MWKTSSISSGVKSSRINSYKDFGGYLLGAVLNKVPRSQVERVDGEMSTQFGEAGIDILGVLPEDRALFTLTIGELAEHIQGEILNSTEKSVELSVMSLFAGIAHFLGAWVRLIIREC